MLQEAFDAFNAQRYPQCALELFEHLALQNNPTALSSLGYMHQKGLGVEASLERL
jgi:TPR repeat protein